VEPLKDMATKVCNAQTYLLLTPYTIAHHHLSLYQNPRRIFATFTASLKLHVRIFKQYTSCMRIIIPTFGLLGSREHPQPNPSHIPIRSHHAESHVDSNYNSKQQQHGGPCEPPPITHDKASRVAQLGSSHHHLRFGANLRVDTPKSDRQETGWQQHG
jgi:hypothetical protein